MSTGCPAAIFRMASTRLMSFEMLNRAGAISDVEFSYPLCHSRLEAADSKRYRRHPLALLSKSFRRRCINFEPRIGTSSVPTKS